MDNKTRAIKLECNCDACAGYYRCKNCGSMSIRHPFDYCPMCGKELEYDASHPTPAQEPSQRAGHDD